MLRTRPLRPLSTSTFRLTLAYLALFSLSAALLLAIVYVASVNFMEQQTRQIIDDEVAWLLEQYAWGRLDVLQAIVDERAAAEPNRRAMYLLTDADGRFLAGNLDRFPEEQPDQTFYAEFVVQVSEGGRRLPTAHAALAKIVELDHGGMLLVGRDGGWLLGLQLTSQDHDLDAEQEAAAGRRWIDIGAGAWDRGGRRSEARVNRVLRIDPGSVRRDGAVLDEQVFAAVTEAVRAVAAGRDYDDDPV